MPVQKLKQDPELQALLESVSKKYRPILLQMLTSLKNKSPAFARHAHVLFSRHVRLGVLRDSSQMTYIAIPEKKFLIHEGFLNEVSDDQVRQSLESLLLNQFATAAHTFNFNASKLDRMIKVGDVITTTTSTTGP